jgi:hypothetical protein
VPKGGEANARNLRIFFKARGPLKGPECDEETGAKEQATRKSGIVKDSIGASLHSQGGWDTPKNELKLPKNLFSV